MGHRAQAWLVAALAAALGGYLVCFPLMDTDIWWHLAAGRWIVEQRAVPRTDPFAADTLGVPWVDVHWLFQLMVYGVHAAAGVAGLVLAKVAVVAVGILLGVRAACRGMPRMLWPAAAVVIVGFLYPARHLVLARPTVLTLLALSLTLLLIERIRADARWRWSAALVAVQIVWANVQGLYLLGPGVVACTVAGDAIAARLPRAGLGPAVGRRARVVLAATVPAMLLASALTPYGPSGLGLPFRLFGRMAQVGAGGGSGDDVFAREVAENLAPWLLERASPGQLGGFKWLAALAFLSFLPLVRRGLGLARLTVVALFFALALLANRNVLLFVWVAGPITAANLARWAADTSVLAKRRAAWALSGVALMLGAALVVGRAREARGEPSITELAPFRVPVAAVERFVAQPPPPGAIFCPDRYGGYLAWRLGPNHRPTMDGRLVLRSAQAYAAHLALGQHPERFARYRDAHDVRAVMLPTAYPDRFLPLVLWLLGQPPWRLLYTDGTETLFVHDEHGQFSAATLDLGQAATAQAIDAELAARHRATPLVLDQARLHLARLLAEAGAIASAEAVLAKVTSRRADTLRARVAYRAGQVERAERLARARLEQQPNESESLCLLALIARDRGDRRAAVTLLGQVLAADPFHPLARRLLDEMAAAEGDR